jgi:hypothetical protein
MKSKIVTVIICLAVIAIFILEAHYKQPKKQEIILTDKERFALEYSEVGNDNIFVYKSIDEIIDILKNKTGVVYLCFSSNMWCKRYSLYLNETAKASKIEEIYYLDISEDMNNNTEKYQELIDILKKYLELDSNKKPKILVPDITIVKNGKIIEHDNTTSNINNIDDVDDYWIERRIKRLKDKLTLAFDKVTNKE